MFAMDQALETAWMTQPFRLWKQPLVLESPETASNSDEPVGLGPWLMESRLVRGLIYLGQRLGFKVGNPYSPMWLWILTVGLMVQAVLLCTASTTVIGLSVLGMLALVGLPILFRRTIPDGRSWSAVDLLVILFFLSAVVAAAFSSYTKPSVVGLAKFFTFASAYGVYRLWVRHTSMTHWMLLLSGLVALGVWQSLVGFSQYIYGVEALATWSDPDTNPELQMTRIFGTIEPLNPNLLAGFLIPCIALSVGLGTWCLTLPGKHKLWSVLYWVASGVIMAALVLTGSRGGMLALGAMALFYFLMVGHLCFRVPPMNVHRKLQVLWVAILIGTLCLGGVAIASSKSLQHRLASITAMRDDSSISYRLNVYDSSIRMIQDNWLTGIGPGNDVFKQVYGMYMVPGYNALGTYSVPLEIAVEQGIFGVLAVLFIVGALLIRYLLMLDTPGISVGHKLLVTGLVTALVGYGGQGLFDTIWYRPPVHLPFWLLMALVVWLTEEGMRTRYLGASPSSVNPQD